MGHHPSPPPPPSEAHSRYPALTADIVAFAGAARPSADEASRRREAFETIARAAHSTEWGGEGSHSNDVRVALFGSCAAGTSLPCSDVDVVIDGPAWAPPVGGRVGRDDASTVDAVNAAIKPAMIRAVRRLADRLRRMSREGAPVGRVVAITRARVPVVRTTVRSVGVDVVFGQRDGIEAANWTIERVRDDEARRRGGRRVDRVDAAEDGTARVTALCRVLKAYLRQHDLGDVAKGGLGGHALTVALIGYLSSVDERFEASRSAAASVDERGTRADAEPDLGALLVGFMTTVGELNVSEAFISSDAGLVKPKPREWMTTSELAARGMETETGGTATSPVSDPPRLGVEDPLCPGRNLVGAAGST